MIILMRSANKSRHWAAGLGYLVGRSARFIWDHKLSLGIGVGLFSVYEISVALPVFVVAPFWLLLAAAVAADLYFGKRFSLRLFDWIRSKMSGARTGRELERAGADCGIRMSVEQVTKTLPGELARVRLGRGETVDRLAKQADAIAGCLSGDVSDVRVIRDPQSRKYADLSIIRRDTFAAMEGTPWPLIDADQVDVDAGIPFGQDEFGRTVNARLLSRNILLGGAPDAGKSTSLRVLIAACALDPKYKLWMLDAKTKGAEFVHWAPAAHRLVRGRNLQEAVELFAELEERVEQREQAIVAAGEVFVLPDMERDVLFIDELPQFLRTRETDTKDEIAAVKSIRGSIWKLISTGRWAGMMTVLSAQKPTADIVPSESRDLIDHRLGLHCNTRAMSDAVMGDGNGESPANAAEIPSGQPGVGYYLGDNGIEKIRTFYIDPKQALEIASRIAGRQMDAELQAMA
jgi:hypothetical protein